MSGSACHRTWLPLLGCSPGASVVFQAGHTDIDGALAADGATTVVQDECLDIQTSLAAIAIAAMSLYALGRWIWYRPLRNATEEQIVHAARDRFPTGLSAPSYSSVTL